MLVTVTNTSGRDINVLETISGGYGPSALLAVGGNRTDPLPFPFGHIGTLAAAATKQLPMRVRDWRYKPTPGFVVHEPSKQWQQMVQAGIVTLTVASEVGNRDEEEIYVDAIL